MSWKARNLCLKRERENIESNYCETSTYASKTDLIYNKMPKIENEREKESRNSIEMLIKSFN